MKRGSWIPLALIMAVLSVPARAALDHFESPPVHPVEITPDGNTLLVINTFDHRLAVFDLTQGPLPIPVGEIPVGMEPVTVRARSNTEAWVVNHVSDSISRIDLPTLRVLQTINVGDEPTDVMFAGSGGRAFVVLSQEDRIAVLDPASGSELSSIPLDGSDPRSLAKSNNGNRLYVTVLDSGNRTTVVGEPEVTGSLGLPPPVPPMDTTLVAAPDVGLIVRHDGVNWVDELSRSWDASVPYTLADNDVIRIDVNLWDTAGSYRGVGTSLFNVAVNPVTGLLYVTNQEASNEVRFEPNHTGQFARMRVTTIDPTGPVVTPVHLNGHINYGAPAGTPAERDLSLSMPLDIVVASDGLTAYVAAFGSAKVGVLDATGAVMDRIDVDDGPCGLALLGSTLYVLNRTAGTISVIDLAGPTVQSIPLGFDGVAPDLRAGRRLFYDAKNSSAHGDLACATCHVFGGMDLLAWDLGDPTGAFQPAPPGQPGSSGFHPMKGPLTTQSLKALSGTEPFHWRGDRADLAAFNSAFVSLQGRGSELSAGDFQLFEDFVFSMRLMPNPFRNLDDTVDDPAFGPNPTDGELAFQFQNLAGAVDCVDCHAFPAGTNGLIIPAATLQDTQDIVVPQLRVLYEKTRFDNTASTTIRGFGYNHDGAIDDLASLLLFPGFFFSGQPQRDDVEAYLLTFPTGTPAAVGAQWTMDGTNEAQGIARVNTLVSLADANTVGLIAKGNDGSGDARGWWYQGGDVFVSDREAEPDLSLAAMLLLAGSGTEITFTAVVDGCEERLGVDRDEDGFRDRDELDAGSDPSNPASTPNTVGLPDADDLPAPILRIAPNPARMHADIALSMELGNQSTVTIHDVRGRRVRTLPVTGPRLRWDLMDESGRPVSAGVYLVRVSSPQGSQLGRLVVLR